MPIAVAGGHAVVSYGHPEGESAGMFKMVAQCPQHQLEGMCLGDPVSGNLSIQGAAKIAYCP